MFPYIHKFPECEDENDFEVHQTSQKEINEDTDTFSILFLELTD